MSRQLLEVSANMRRMMETGDDGHVYFTKSIHLVECKTCSEMKTILETGNCIRCNYRTYSAKIIQKRWREYHDAKQRVERRNQHTDRELAAIQKLSALSI